MNILFIEKASDGTVGGSHTCLYNLIHCLDRNAYNVSVGLYQNNSFVEKLRRCDVNVFLLSKNPIFCGNVFIRKIRNWYRLVYRHRLELRQLISSRQIDLLVLNNSIAGGNDYVHVGKKLNVPIISYERGFVHYTKSDIHLSKQIDASIAVSRAVRRNMFEQSYSAKARVIYDGLPFDNTTASAGGKDGNELKRQLGIPAESTVIGIIGNIREWKGQEYFIKAFLSMGRTDPDLYGLVIGEYGIEDREYIDYLQKLTAESEIGDRLLFLGFRDDVPALLDILDVFVHASIKPEPFGMVLLEAMRQKVPIVATDIGGPIEILDGGKCGILVSPGNEEAIIEAVERYLKDRAFSLEMVERAYERIRKEFNLQETARQIDCLFREVVGKTGVGLRDLN